jgi:hypothetical protein
MRQPAARVKPRLAKLQSFPAPVGGWIKNVNLATPDARLPNGQRVNGASVLENWFPTATGCRMRGGSQLHTVTNGSEAVTALFTYVDGNNRSLFAATDTAIFNVTTATDFAYLVDDLGNQLVDDLGNALVTGTTLSSSGVSLTGGDWSVVQFTTAGGTFLRAVNGVDTPLVYDGAVWGTSPALTGLTVSTLSNVWSFKNRLFFVEKDTQNAWYLAVDAIGGALTKFPLGCSVHPRRALCCSARRGRSIPGPDWTRNVRSFQLRARSRFIRGRTLETRRRGRWLVFIA